MEGGASNNSIGFTIRLLLLKTSRHIEECTIELVPMKPFVVLVEMLLVSIRFCSHVQ